MVVTKMRKLAFLFFCGFGLFMSQTGAQMHKALRPAVDFDYRDMLKECGMAGAKYSVGFLRFSKGLWPVSSTMIVMDSTKGYLEYDDSPYPWERVRRPSMMYLTNSSGLKKEWEWLTSQKSIASYSECGLTVTNYSSINTLGYAASIVTDQKDYLLLIGPIADSVDVALQCYMKTIPTIGASCK